jgi:hypothetical protein
MILTIINSLKNLSASYIWLGKLIIIFCPTFDRQMFDMANFSNNQRRI